MKNKLGRVEFDYSKRSRKWEFHSKLKGGRKHIMLLACDGKSHAEKAATIINASVKRVNELDGLCRAQLGNIGL